MAAMAAEVATAEEVAPVAATGAALEGATGEATVVAMVAALELGTAAPQAERTQDMPRSRRWRMCKCTGGCNRR